MSEIADKVKKIVVEHLAVEEAKVRPKASFTDDLGADSLGKVELVMAFEEEFELEIDEEFRRQDCHRSRRYRLHREAEDIWSVTSTDAATAPDARVGHQRKGGRAAKGRRARQAELQRDRTVTPGAGSDLTPPIAIPTRRYPSG